MKRTVWAWGANDCGQLGVGDQNAHDLPVRVEGLENVKQVSAGWKHSAALKTDGTVWSWGYNSYQVIGVPSPMYVTSPQQVQGIDRVTAIVAGNSFSAALRDDGTVWVWGLNPDGILGVGTTPSHVVSSPTQVPDITDVKMLTTARTYIMALRGDGTVWAWGTNSTGQLGDGTTTWRTSPVQVQGLDHVVSIGAGHQTSLAVRSDGTLWAWGINNHGQIGDGTSTDRWSPVQVPNVSNVAEAGSAWSHSAALLADGTVFAWGANYSGQLGDGTVSPLSGASPRQVPNLTNVIGLAVGMNHNIVRRTDGRMRAWGYGDDGQLGNGPVGPPQTSPADINGIAMVQDASACNYHALGLSVESDHLKILVEGPNFRHTYASYLREGDFTWSHRGFSAQVRGEGKVPGASGGLATVRIELSQMWFLPFLFGTISIEDPLAGVSREASVRWVWPEITPKVVRTRRDVSLGGGWRAYWSIAQDLPYNPAMDPSIP